MSSNKTISFFLNGIPFEWYEDNSYWEAIDNRVVENVTFTEAVKEVLELSDYWLPDVGEPSGRMIGDPLMGEWVSDGFEIVKSIVLYHNLEFPVVEEFKPANVSYSDDEPIPF